MKVMAETFDSALREEQKEAYEAQQDQERADQLENDRDFLQSFLDWLYEQNDSHSFLAVVKHGEMYADCGGSVLSVTPNGDLFVERGTDPYPWQTLWKMWLETLK